MSGMLVQEMRTGSRTMTWTCGREGCDFTVVKDITAAQPGDHFELPEIDAHNFEAHSARQYVGLDVRREPFTAVSLSDLIVDEDESR